MSAPLTNSGSVDQTAYDILRAHLSPAFNGPAWTALLEAIATGDQANWDNVEKALGQLFLMSSGDGYLDAHGSKDGVPRPEGVGIGDENYRKLVLAIRTRQLSADAIYRVLEVFYGEEAVRAYLQVAAEPYTLTTGHLWLQFEDKEHQIDLTAGTYTAEELANIITTQLNVAGSRAYAKAWTNGETNVTYLRIYSGALGLRGSVKPTGGSAMLELGMNGQRTITDAIGTLSMTKLGDSLKVTLGTTPIVLASSVADKSYLGPDSVLWTWGYYSSFHKLTPFRISSGWRTVANKVFTTLAIKQDGSLWAWGSNGSGQFGNGSTIGNSSPVHIGVLTNWGTIDVSSHSLSVKTNGQLWGWGENGSHQLGLGASTTDRTTPVQIGTDVDWLDAKCGGNYSLAIKQDGTVWAWGDDTYGQLGRGFAGPQVQTPTQVNSGFSSVYTNGTITATSAGIKTDGSLWVWGNNSSGQLGIGSADNAAHPTPVQMDTDVVHVSVGIQFIHYIKSDGSLWACGKNAYGELGDGTTNDAHTPIQVGTDFANVASGAGGEHVIAIKTDKTIWVWGSNIEGELGIGSQDNNPHPNPTQITIPLEIDLGVKDDDIVTLTGGGYEGHYVAYDVDKDALTFYVKAKETHVSGSTSLSYLLAYAPFRYTLQESTTTAVVSVTRGGYEVSIPVSTIIVDRTEDTASYIDDGTGPFIYDPVTGYSLTARQSTTTSTIRIQQTLRSIPVADSDPFNETGWVILGLGCSYQTGPIRYIGKNVGNLIIDTSTLFDKTIPSGATVIEVLGRGAWQPALDQYNDEFTIVNSGNALKYAKDTIKSVLASGLPVNVNVQYPSGYGYGGHLSPVSDVVRIYGSDEPNNDVSEVE